MSITVLTYHDQSLVDQINTNSAASAASSAEVSDTSSFSAALEEASQTKTTSENTSNSNNCPDNLYSIFEEAASTFQLPVHLLTSIARAESNFKTDAVSHAGAVGVMQLMPATAASLGVTDSYNARENIMGGAKLISQLLSKYNGNTSLALAAYNAGSGNVDKYGGIPPFTETQNYVQKVLSYFNTENRSDLKETVSNFLASKNVSKDTLYLLADLLKLIKAGHASSETGDSTANIDAASTISAASATPTEQITVEVIDKSDSHHSTADDLTPPAVPHHLLQESVAGTTDSNEDETSIDTATVIDTDTADDTTDTSKDTNAADVADTVEATGSAMTDDIDAVFVDAAASL